MYSYLEEAGYTGKISEQVVVNLMEKKTPSIMKYIGKKVSAKHIGLLRLETLSMYTHTLCIRQRTEREKAINFAVSLSHTTSGHSKHLK